MESLHDKIANAQLSVEDDALPWLEKLNEIGDLSIGWPNCLAKAGLTLGHKEASGQNDSLPALLPSSFVWFPDGRPPSRTTSIVSSRIGRQVDSLDKIFQVLRTAIAQLDPQRHVVLSVEGTTTHDFVARACELFSLPLLKAITPSPKTSVKNWAMASLKSFRLQSFPARPDDAVCFVSNPVQGTASSPLRDQIEVLASDQLLVLSVRRTGNLHRLISARLERPAPTRVFLALGHEQLVDRQISTELMDDGAVGWLLIGSEDQVVPCPLETLDIQPLAPVIPMRSMPNQDRYLTHCTRRARGAWPDQPHDDYLDELILGEQARDRSSFAALMRIVRMQRLLASGESIRDSTPVVSLTAARIDELSSMRTFRAHRGRWDFEPYGVSVNSELLAASGVRKVIYGNDKVWDELSNEDRPYFQKLNAASGIDWSVEQEWRVVGDIDLSEVPADKAFVFVPTETEAKHLATVSRWPVVVMDCEADENQLHRS